MHPPHDWDEQRAAVRALIFDETASQHVTDTDSFYARTDFGDVERTVARMVDGVFRRSRRGALPPADMYSRTLADTAPHARAELARRFFSSPWFACYGELPDRVEQLSIEEAFYRFLCDEQIGDAEIRRAEFVDAMICALAVQPRPAFRIPPEIRVTSYGYSATVRLVGREIHVATDGKHIARRAL